MPRTRRQATAPDNESPAKTTTIKRVRKRVKPVPSPQPPNKPTAKSRSSRRVESQASPHDEDEPSPPAKRKRRRTTVQRKDEALIKAILDSDEVSVSTIPPSSTLTSKSSAAAVRSSIPTMPVQRIRTVLSDIRKRKKDLSVVYCSDHILKDMTVGEFCFEYVLGNARKRYEKHQRSSTKNQDA